MTYTDRQIEIAKSNYNNFLQNRSLESFDPEYVGYNTAEQRCDYHNNLVNDIKNGNKELEREWKLFFLKEIVKSDKKQEESKNKLKLNKEASADVLEPIKKLRKIGEFGKWLNNSKNPYRKEHFNKKYTIESVTEFLNTL